jgi:outer membrane protein assembly factor BamE (lipoprotein component of BamABCDE complex)
MKRQTIIILSICFLLTACKDNVSFDKAGWTIQGDLGLYPNRDKMLEDLTKNQILKGLTYRQLIEKMGEPEKNVIGDSNAIYYDIVIDYGHDIDPVYTKTVEFKFDKDSIITDFKINETKH